MEVVRAVSSRGKRKEVWHLLMLPKQEVLRGRAGSSLLFKGENTEKAVVWDTGARRQELETKLSGYQRTQ